MIHYLHLSDLHLTAQENKGPVEAFNQNVVTRSMVDMIRDAAFDIDFVIVTGDIARMGKPAEYAVCEVFCERLLAALGLGQDRLFLVPGNHDVDRSVITNRHIKRLYGFDDQDEITEILTGPDDFPILMRKFEGFNAFSEKVMDRRRLDDAAYWYAERLNLQKANGECGINLVGLNSCLFAGYDGDEDRKLALGLYQVEAALKNLRKGDLSICFFHHPFHCFHPEDKVCRNLLMNQFDLILTGHLHDPSNAFTREAAGQALIIGAGAGFENRESRNSFNVVKIDPETGEGTVQFYKYLPDHNRWKEDTDVNPDAADGRFGFRLGRAVSPKRPDKDKSVRKAPSNEAAESQAEIDAYKEKIASLHEHLPLVGFKTKLRVPIRIEDVYVPLRAMVDLRATGDACFADSEDAENCLKTRGEGREISVPDAFREARRLNRRGIVILGDPGSGKTTHLRRLLIWCLRGGLADLGLPADAIPVFLPLRDLEDLNHGLDAFIQHQLDGPHLDTPDGFGARLLRRGNLLLLFDGLDEVAEPEQRIKVSQWLNEAMQVHQTCRFVVTSRFAGYTPEARLSENFIEMHMRPFSEEQAEIFIRNWYRSVEVGVMADSDQAAVIAGQRADDLVDRLRQPEFRARRVFEMTRNPLLLTNLCLVHRDRGNLPYGRAQLYEECIDVLLELWRGAIRFKGKVTAKTGRRVLQPAALWMHGEEERTRASAAELAPVMDPVLKSVGWPHGSAAEFLKAVRDESGLLTGWGQDSYGFMHLGFQEYLTAREIRDRTSTEPSVLRDLANKFGQGWWQEVILCVLAFESPPLFTPFMSEVINEPALSDNGDLVEMCLDDAAEISSEPFLELLDRSPGNDLNFWNRQLLALRAVERMDGRALKGILKKLQHHPYDAIKKWVEARLSENWQDTIFIGPVEYELVQIPGGVFMMGSKYVYSGEPVHKVQLPVFYMGRYPVTNQDYARFLEANPNAIEPSYWADRKFNQPRQPVIGVSWYDARLYAEWVGLDLPTEAQWEYACRAGTMTEYYTGDLEEDLDSAGWYDENSKGKTHVVGGKEPNAFWLYDMHGNVDEWVEDHFHNSYYGAPTDGSAWVDMENGDSGRVIRGGSWLCGVEGCRSATRCMRRAADRRVDVGFRLAMRLGQ